MKLIIYSNIESYNDLGLLSPFGLNTNRLSESPIKGISANASCNNVQNLEQAKAYNILLCHQEYIEAKSILPLVDLSQDWAIVLHDYKGASLRLLYSQISKSTKAQVIYRYEASTKGATIELFRKIVKDKSKFHSLLHPYFNDFKAEALDVYIEELLKQKNLIKNIARLVSQQSEENYPYLIQRLLAQQADLKSLFEDYASVPSSRPATLKKIISAINTYICQKNENSSFALDP